MPANKAPAPVDTGPVALSPVGPLDKGPAPVPQGTATGVYPPAPGSKIPQTSAPKPVAVSSKAVEEDIIPVTEKAVDVGNTVQVNTNVSNAPPRYVNVYGNGSLVVQAASTLNFTGNGVSVTAGNSSGSAQISIVGGQGNVVVDWGNVGNSIIPNSNNTYDVGSGSNRWATMYAVDVNATGDVTTGGNISAGNFIGNGAGLTGITQIVNGDNVWTFDTVGALNVPASGTIRPTNREGGPVNTVSSNFVQLQWTTDTSNADPNYTDQPTNWIYVDGGGGHIEVGINTANTFGWGFGLDGTFTAPGNISVDGSISATGNLYVSNVVSNGNLVVYDPLVYFVANVAYPYNYDIGFYSHFVGGTGNTYQHTGLVRDYHDNTWKLFSNVPEPTGNAVNFTNAIYDPLQVGTLTANVVNIPFGPSNALTDVSLVALTQALVA